MSQLDASARVSARTVTRVSRGDVEQPAQRRTRATERRVRTSRVLTRTVHPLVLERALALAGGDPSRIVVESETSVLVR